MELEEKLRCQQVKNLLKTRLLKIFLTLSHQLLTKDAPVFVPR